MYIFHGRVCCMTPPGTGSEVRPHLLRLPARSRDCDGRVSTFQARVRPGRRALFSRRPRDPTRESRSPHQRLCVPAEGPPPRPARPSLPRHLLRSPAPRLSPCLIRVSSEEAPGRFLSLELGQCLAWKRHSSRGVWSEPGEGAGCPIQVCPAFIAQRVSVLPLHHPYLKYFHPWAPPGSGNKISF